jgi:hypothetical protein
VRETDGLPRSCRRCWNDVPNAPTTPKRCPGRQSSGNCRAATCPYVRKPCGGCCMKPPRAPVRSWPWTSTTSTYPAGAPKSPGLRPSTHSARHLHRLGTTSATPFRRDPSRREECALADDHGQDPTSQSPHSHALHPAQRRSRRPSHRRATRPWPPPPLTAPRRPASHGLSRSPPHGWRGGWRWCAGDRW